MSGMQTQRQPVPTATPASSQAPSGLPSSTSYPQRVHIRERAEYQALLQGWEERIASARQQFAAYGSGPNRSALERLLAQMSGARDQLADAARRLPMEVGGLYEEDRLRLDEAVAALERLSRRWEELSR